MSSIYLCKFSFLDKVSPFIKILTHLGCYCLVPKLWILKMPLPFIVFWYQMCLILALRIFQGDSSPPPPSVGCSLDMWHTHRSWRHSKCGHQLVEFGGSGNFSSGARVRERPCPHSNLQDSSVTEWDVVSKNHKLKFFRRCGLVEGSR